MSINFEDINQRLLARAKSLIPTMLPGGKQVGREWVCANVNGGSGGSFSINTETGIWADFSTGEKGGDIVSLYALQRGLSQTEAAKEISDQIGVPAVSIPVFRDRANAKYAGIWVYNDKSGVPVAAVARYNEPNGKKTFSQCHFAGGKWIFKSHPDPRPLYNLDKLWADKKPVIIVEGEKTADAANRIAGNVYTATTWIGGSNAVLSKVDWSPLHGRDVLVIPDADATGRKAMDDICKILTGCKIKLCNTSDMSPGWDLADQSDWKWADFYVWAKPRSALYGSSPIVPTPAPIPAPTPVLVPALVTSEAITPEILADRVPEPQQSPVTSADLSEVDDACPASVKEMWLDMGIPMAGNKPIINILAVVRVFQHVPSFRDNIWYDEFYRNIFINGEEIRDDHEIAITVVLQSRYGLSGMKEGVVRSAIIYHARQNTRNEPKQWIESLKWDGIPRVRSFFHKYMGTPNDEYHQDVSKYFLLSMAARIVDHGIQADNAVVLVGCQGIKKSTSLMAIAGKKWFAVASAKIGKPDFISSMRGKILMEIGEMSAAKKAHVEDVKLVCSNRIDCFRVPYDRNHQDLPRICMLAGTTNEDQFLVDDTGNRRFYPINPIQCNAELISRDREQLFAEALAIFNLDRVNWWTVTDDSIEHQEHHRISDPWEDVLKDYDIFRFHQNGMDPYAGVKVHDVAKKIFNIDSKDLTKIVTTRIATALRKYGFRRGVVTLKDRSTARIWRLDRSPNGSEHGSQNGEHGSQNGEHNTGSHVSQLSTEIQTSGDIAFDE